MYADDTVLYSTSPCTLEIYWVVQDDLNRVQQNQYSLEVGKVGSQRATKFSYLGVVLDETLQERK